MIRDCPREALRVDERRAVLEGVPAEREEGERQRGDERGEAEWEKRGETGREERAEAERGEAGRGEKGERKHCRRKATAARRGRWGSRERRAQQRRERAAAPPHTSTASTALASPTLWRTHILTLASCRAHLSRDVASLSAQFCRGGTRCPLSKAWPTELRALITGWGCRRRLCERRLSTPRPIHRLGRGRGVVARHRQSGRVA